jgi:hypothetical protein
MKVTSDDPVLTAYVLDELAEKERTLVARAISANEELLREEAAISSLSGLLTATLGGKVLSLGEDRIAEIHRAGQRPDSGVLVLEHRKRSRRQSFLAVAGVAAVVTLGFLLLSRFEVGGKTSSGGDGVAGALQSDEIVVAAGDSPDLPGRLAPEVAGAVGIPLQTGRADPSMVEKALETTGRLPARDRFLVADWIQLGAPMAEPLATFNGLLIWYELGPCSWNPSASLLMIRLEARDGLPLEVTASLELNPGRVRELRLAGGGGNKEEAPPVTAVIREAKTFLYELDLAEDEGELGTLKLLLGPSLLKELPLAGEIRSRDEVSTAFATAGILGDFARWGASEERDRETLVRLARGAKALLAEVSDETARYALDMILISEESLEQP